MYNKQFYQNVCACERCSINWVICCYTHARTHTQTLVSFACNSIKFYKSASVVVVVVVWRAFRFLGVVWQRRRRRRRRSGIICAHDSTFFNIQSSFMFVVFVVVVVVTLLFLSAIRIKRRNSNKHFIMR